MRVICTKNPSIESNDIRLGVKQDFHVTVGKEYVALGLSFWIGSSVRGTGTWLEVIDDSEHLVSVPLALFDVRDGRCSRYWELKAHSDGGVTLWPPSFYEEYYHEDVAEGVDNVVADLRRVREVLTSEAFSANLDRVST